MILYIIGFVKWFSQILFNVHKSYFAEGESLYSHPKKSGDFERIWGDKLQ